MKKSPLFLVLFISLSFGLMAQQPMSISPGLVVASPTAGNSGLRFSNLNSGTTVSTTPTKVLSLDASGNVILGNAASGSSTSSTSPAVSIPVYTNGTARSNAILTASTGMLTYNSASTGPEIFNGTSWIPVNYWTFNSSTNRVVSPSGGATGIEAYRFISQGSSSVTSPVFAFSGPNSVFRYARSGPDGTAEAVTQETTASFQPGSSSVVWNHYLSTTSTPTRLFGFSAGTLTVNGFTKLGDDASTTTSGVTTSSPAIKTILLTGGIGAATTTVAHGLNYNKIVNIKVLVLSTSINGGRLVAEDATEPAGYQFATYTDGNNVYIVRNASNSTNITPVAGSVTANYKILITYTP